MNKIINKLIYKYGIDKSLHYGFGGRIAYGVILFWLIMMQSMSLFQILLASLVSGVFVFLISVLKEVGGTMFDWKDILAAQIGWFTSVLKLVLIALIF